MKALFTHNNRSDRFSLASKEKVHYSDIDGYLEVKANDNGVNVIVVKFTSSNDNRELLVHDGEQYFHNMHFRFTKALKERFNYMLNFVHDSNDSLTNGLPLDDTISTSDNSQLNIKVGNMSNNPKTEVTETIVNVEMLKALDVLSKSRKKVDIATALTEIAELNGKEVDYSKKEYKELKEIKKLFMVNVSAEDKKEVIPTPKITSKRLDTLLSDITTKKAEVKTLQSTIKLETTEAIRLLNDKVRVLRDENDMYKQAPKKTLVKLIKASLDSKEQLINVVCDCQLLGLQLDNTLTIGQLKTIVKMVKSDSISKSKVSKLDKAGILSAIKEYNKALAIDKAKKLIG